jgi:nicotinate-nucleotide adenylyltransferase
MCQLVAQSDPFFAVDDLELRLSAPSYTLETIRELRKRGWAEVHWMIGADMVQILPKWHRPLELIQETKLWIARRPGYHVDWQSLPTEFRQLESQIVTAPDVEISATEIRQRVATGKSIRYLVSDEVAKYIETEGLYRS